MTLQLTPELLEATYELLRLTSPYDGWNLPHGEDIKFSVDCKSRTRLAFYQKVGDSHTIGVSSHGIGYTPVLLRTMGHEMIHLYLEIMGWESRGNESVHNAAFRKFSARACKIHGWDPKEFY